MSIPELVVAVVTILSILFFAIYVAGLFQLSIGRRSRTPTFDRLGHRLPSTQNPGYEETEDEQHQ